MEKNFISEEKKIIGSAKLVRVLDKYQRKDELFQN